MQKTMLNGKPQKALCASTTVFKDINYSWKKKYSWNNLEYIPLYLGAVTDGCSLTVLYYHTNRMG